MLLNHFVRQRLYYKDLKNGEILETIGGKPIKIQRKQDNVTVNNAQIIEAEQFVYNLGTMFYIDDILYPEIIEETLKAPVEDTVDAGGSSSDSKESTTEKRPTGDVEVFTVNNPSEANLGKTVTEPEDTTVREDEEEEIITPRALPVKYQVGP